MEKHEAVLSIIKDARTDRASKASLKRLQKALKALGLTEEGTRSVEAYLDYRDGRNGELYPQYR
jgi:hypothetical protein